MYRAPIKDLHFVLDELLVVASLATLPRYQEFSAELALDIVLNEIAERERKFLLLLLVLVFRPQGILGHR